MTAVSGRGSRAGLFGERNFMPRDLKTWGLLVSGLLFGALAQAACYTVMDARGTVLSQTSTPPVDMSRPLHQTVPARYGKGAHMVFGVADETCGPPADQWFDTASAQRQARPAKADRG